MTEHYDPFKEDPKKKLKLDPFLDNERAQAEKERKILDAQDNVNSKATFEEKKYRQDEFKTLPYRKESVSPLVSGGFWIRFVTFLIDTIIASSFAGIFASPIIALLGWPDNWIPAGITGFFYFSYFVLSTKFTNGQTLGKMITGLRTIHKTEETLSWTTILIRELCCRLIQNAFPILYIVTAFTPLKQSIADLLSDTYVVKEELYIIEQKEPNLFYQYI